MRVDLRKGGRRPLLARIFLWLLRRYVGVDSGPPSVLSYRPDLLGKDLMRYLGRALRPHAGWDKGHLEMFNAYISKLNQCTF